MKDPVIWSIGLAKFFLAGIFTFLVRLITPVLGLPNVSPLMATELAGGKAYGPWVAGAYGFASMIAIDAFMGEFDPFRSLVTASCYALIGIVAAKAMVGRRPRMSDFMLATIAGTLFFDATTGPIMQHWKYHVPLVEATVGQIPFTAKHLAGNLMFALCAPWFYQAFASTSLEFRLMGMRGGLKT